MRMADQHLAHHTACNVLEIYDHPQHYSSKLYVWVCTARMGTLNGHWQLGHDSSKFSLNLWHQDTPVSQLRTWPGQGPLEAFSSADSQTLKCRHDDKTFIHKGHFSRTKNLNSEICEGNCPAYQLDWLVWTANNLQRHIQAYIKQHELWHVGPNR